MHFRSNSALIIRFFCVILTAFFAILFFFHNQIENGFRFLFSDQYDGIIELSILQHWWNFFQGFDSWNNTNYFFPYKDTLGYNDGYFLYGILYSAFRIFQFDWVIGGTLVHVSIKCLGVFGMYWFLHDGVKCRFHWSLLGAFVFTVANGYQWQSDHGQLHLIALAPFEAIFLINFLSALLYKNRKRAIIYGLAAALLYASWILTAYYMAWFFTFFTVIMAMTGMIAMGRPGYRAIGDMLRTEKWIVLLVLVVLAILLIPFLIVYLPKTLETGMHNWRDAKHYSPEFINIWNVGPANLMWSNGFAWLHHTLQPSARIDGEFANGLTPILFVCGIIGIFSSFRQNEAGWNRPYLWAGITVLITWAAILKFGNVSGWRPVFYLFPGAKGLRTIVRYQMFLTFPMIVFAIRWLDQRRTITGRWLALMTGVLLIVEQWNSNIVPLDRYKELAAMANIPAIPANCDSFYVITARDTPYPVHRSDDTLYPHNTDAMMISALQQRPTINGFSTFNPPDWQFQDATRPDYRTRVRAYLRRHQLSNVCGLDLAHRPGWFLERS